MLLKVREGRQIVKVEDIRQLQNPFEEAVLARPQQGEEEQDPQLFEKRELCFPSGEELPRSWRDAHYRDAELDRRHDPGRAPGRRAENPGLDGKA